MKRYFFTTKLHDRVCRICYRKFSEEWSHGGVGAVCRHCIDTRDEMDLVKMGIIKNIKRVPDPSYSEKYTYEFEALIDGKWYKCSRPVGNWCGVDGYLREHNIFCVPVGHWELHDLYLKHFNNN